MLVLKILLKLYLEVQALRKIRVLVYEKPSDAYWNLAVEEAIPRAVAIQKAPPTLRFFRNENAVIIGVFQYAEKEVNLEYALKNDVQIVRRFTGGGAVYHDMGNLNYALSLPFSEFNVPKDIIEYYSFFLNPLVSALKKLGFENVSKGLLNDIELNKRKVGGSAGSTKWNIAFFHGTLLVSTDIDRLSNVLKVPRVKLSDKGVPSVKKRVINLSSVRPDISQEEIIEEIIKSYSEHLNAEVYEGELGEEERKIAEALYNVKYSRREWNLERLNPLIADGEVEKILRKTVLSKWKSG